MPHAMVLLDELTKRIAGYQDPPSYTSRFELAGNNQFVQRAFGNSKNTSRLSCAGVVAPQRNPTMNWFGLRLGMQWYILKVSLSHYITLWKRRSSIAATPCLHMQL